MKRHNLSVLWVATKCQLLPTNCEEKKIYSSCHVRQLEINMKLQDFVNMNEFSFIFDITVQGILIK